MSSYVPGEIATPVQTFTHPEYENEVTLVGTIHIGEPRYYAELQQLVDNRHTNGAAVHYEWTREPTAAELQNAPAKLLTKAARIRSNMRTLYSWFEGLGLAHQTEHFAFRDGWENHDASELELVSRINSFNVRCQTVGINVMHSLMSSMEEGIRRDTVLSMLGGLSSSPRKPLLTRLLLGNDGAVIHYRNGIALAAFDCLQAENPGADAALVWGVKHLPDLGDGLAERGFIKVHEQPIPAITVSA